MDGKSSTEIPRISVIMAANIKQPLNVKPEYKVLLRRVKVLRMSREAFLRERSLGKYGQLREGTFVKYGQSK